PRNTGSSGTRLGTARAGGNSPKTARRSGPPGGVERPGTARTRLGTAAGRHRRHRRDGLAVAPGASAGRRRLMSIWRRLIEYALPYRGRLAIALLAMLAYGAGSLALPVLIKPVLDKLSQEPNAANISAAWVSALILVAYFV